MSKRRAPTIYDVARDAGVSVATVSRVLKGKPTVNHEIRARVEASIERLQYVPNRTAQNLARRKSEVIGLITTDIENPFFGRLAKAAELAAREANYTLILCNTASDPGQERKCLEVMWRERVAGILWVPCLDSPNRDLVAQVAEEIPIVAVDEQIDGCDSVCVDHHDGVKQIVEHFCSLGHQRIAYVGGDNPKRAHFQKIVSEQFGLDPSEVLVFSPSDYTDWVALCKDLLSARPRPTGVWAHNDRAAVHLYDALDTLSLAVPGDLSIAGYDDTDLARALRPRLTTVAQSSDEMGTQAVMALLRRIERRDIPRMQIKLQPRLVVRESTASVRGTALACKGDAPGSGRLSR